MSSEEAKADSGLKVVPKGLWWLALEPIFAEGGNER